MQARTENPVRPQYPENGPAPPHEQDHRDARRGIAHVRADVGKIDEPRAQALFETTAEVLQGLKTAYDHYERKAEPAWR